MDVLALLQDQAEDATRRLAPYVIQYWSSGYRVVRLSPHGESHMGRFIDREAAEAYLLSRLPQPAPTKVEP